MTESKHVEFPSRFIDPIEPGEPKFALFSFTPAPHIRADERGFFGVAKIRGAFHTYAEASRRAEDIIRHVDSSNSVFTQRIGEPFPLVVKGHADGVDEVKIGEKIDETLRENERQQKLEDRRAIDNLKEREEALKRDVDPTTVIDPKDLYLEQRIKLAHLTHHAKTLRIQIKEALEKREKCRLELKKMIDDDPQLEEDYVERYMQARRKANIPESTDDISFMKHLRDDLDEELLI